MPDLHPEVLKEIEAGPQQVAIGKDGIGVESYAMFARRVALRAVELEREAMRDAITDEIMAADATWSRGEAVDVATQAIRRRGEAVSLNPERQHDSDKTHYADPDTLATLAKLERENADLRADRDRAFKIGYEITDDCQTVEEMTSALVACIQRVRMNKDKELADLRAKLEEARKDAERKKNAD